MVYLHDYCSSKLVLMVDSNKSTLSVYRYHTRSHSIVTLRSKQQSHYEVHFTNMATEFKRLFGLPKIVQKLSVLTLSLTLLPYHQSQVFIFSTKF